MQVNVIQVNYGDLEQYKKITEIIVLYGKDA